MNARLLPPVLLALAAAPLHAAVAPTFTHFLQPAGWALNAPLSTYQEWTADPTDKIDGIPNVASNSSSATLVVNAPGFIPSTGGGYAFAGPYSLTAALTPPAATVPAGAGTHVILQTFASLNVYSVLGITLADAAGNPIPGAVQLRHTEFGFESGFESPVGPADAQATITEFWLPDFTSGFKAVIAEQIHSSFMGLRVDTFITAPAAGNASPFAATPVPEPASLGLLGLAAVALFRRRSRG